MKPITPRSLRLKIALLLCLILPFNILGLISSKMSYDNALNRVEDMISYTMRSYADILSERLSDADGTLQELVENDTYFITAARQDFSWQYDFSVYQVYLTLENHITSSNSADLFFIYMNQADDLIQVPYPSAVSYSRGQLGLDSELIMNQIRDYSQNIGQWVLIGANNQRALIKTSYDPIFDVYYGSCIELQSTIHDLKSAIDFDTIDFFFSESPQNGTSERIVWNISILDDLYLNALISRNEMGHSISPLQYIIFALFALFLLLVPVLFLLIQHYVITPLNALNLAHDQLAEGNEDYRIDAQPSSAEFGNAFHSFNHMASTLQELKQNIVNQEIANKQLQIDYLQLQIRPHFLLNTFNVLFTLIQKNEKDHAQKLILYLSDYFRYIFRSGHQLQPISNELKLIRGYLDITSIYYPDAFTVSFQIDPMIELMQVPPLLLHSFIENIIQHALVPGKVVNIIFSGEWTDEYVIFYISDDGSGMSQESIERINTFTSGSVSDGHNVGLKNSIGRLKHYFGKNADVTVESEIGEGTTFTIKIPYRLEDSIHESAIGQ